jgi:hypothetical protein
MAVIPFGSAEADFVGQLLSAGRNVSGLLSQMGVSASLCRVGATLLQRFLEVELRAEGAAGAARPSDLCAAEVEMMDRAERAFGRPGDPPSWVRKYSTPRSGHNWLGFDPEPYLSADGKRMRTVIETLRSDGWLLAVLTAECAGLEASAVMVALPDMFDEFIYSALGEPIMDRLFGIGMVRAWDVDASGFAESLGIPPQVARWGEGADALIEQFAAVCTGASRSWRELSA